MKALEGVKILDFCWVLAGPQVTRCMADFGATVVRIESRTYSDILRTIGPFKDNVSGLNRSAYFANVNCNKYDMSLNLKKPQAMEIIRQLVLWADVVTENFTPGEIAKRGLSYDDLVKIKPDIIMMSLSTQGQTGPDSQGPGWGAVAEGISGLADLSGWPDRLPSISQFAWGDAIIPRFGMMALLAALDYRARTGRGQYLDVCQLEAQAYLMAISALEFSATGKKTTRIGNRSDQACPQGVYPCKGEDRWCAISIADEEEWQLLARIIGKDWENNSRFETFADRKRNEDELDKLISNWTAGFTISEVVNLLQKQGIDAAPVSDSEMLDHDPQLRHRGFWELEHPEIGKFAQDTWGFKLSQTPAEPVSPAPRLGEHTRYVCTEILGMDAKKFAELEGSGVFD